MLRGRRGMQAVTAQIDININILIELMNLEARKNFLLLHAKNLQIDLPPLLSDLLALDSSETTREETREQKKERLKRQIKLLEETLGRYPEHKDYLSGVLLPKVGTDADRISTRIARHFQQLSATGEDQPYVDLAEAELRLYWNKKEDAEKFHRFLLAHAIPATYKKGQLEGEVPEAMKSLPANQRYQSDEDTYVVSLSHLYVEQFLALAQYHSYSLKPVVNDWYEAKKLNRSQLITQEGVKKQGDASQEKLEVQYVEARRVHLNEAEDLVAVDITAAVAPTTQQAPHVVILFDDSGSMDDNGGKK